MNRIPCFAILLSLATICKGQSIGGMAGVAIIDRDTGAALTPHYYHGSYWVAGKPGARYAIEIRNRLGERLLAVTSVDGVNVVSGATAKWDQAGYVFGPRESYQITGWRKSDAQVAAFTFTESPNSYAELTGRPANVGVIGVAVFRERQPLPDYVPPAIGQSPNQPAAPRADESAGAAARESMGSPAAADALKLGTGHGEREASYVSRTDFQRLQAQPNEVIRIRYDSLDKLIAMGIIKRSRPMPPTADPFPESSDQSYVPDPPG
jgi:hypothetical protein